MCIGAIPLSILNPSSPPTPQKRLAPLSGTLNRGSAWVTSSYPIGYVVVYIAGVIVPDSAAVASEHEMLDPTFHP